MREIFSPNLSWVVAVAAAFTAYFQWRKTQEDRQAFRQQLISLLHHAEGVRNSLFSIWNSAARGKFSNVIDIAAAIEAADQNAEAMFFGLVESKVGGVPLKDELDRKYAEWADTVLELKIKPGKDFLKKETHIDKI